MLQFKSHVELTTMFLIILLACHNSWILLILLIAWQVGFLTKVHFQLFHLCVKWFFWKERNYRTFKGTEQPMVVVKLIFLCTLYNWMATMGGKSFSSLLDLLDWTLLHNLDAPPAHWCCFLVFLFVLMGKSKGFFLWKIPCVIYIKKKKLVSIKII